MVSVNTLVETLLERAPASVAEAGDYLLAGLSGGQLERHAFLNDPLALVGPPYFVPRYLAQVTLCALKSEYEAVDEVLASQRTQRDRKSTRLNSSHSQISYAVFCLKKKKIPYRRGRQGTRLTSSHSQIAQAAARCHRGSRREQPGRGDGRAASVTPLTRRVYGEHVH